MSVQPARLKFALLDPQVARELGIVAANLPWAQLSNNPNAAEESFDHAWIAHLNGYANAAASWERLDRQSAVTSSVSCVL